VADDHEPLDLVRAVFRAWNGGDVESSRDLFAPDFEWRPILGTLGEGETVYRGFEGIQQYRRDVEDVVGTLPFEVHSMEAFGDRVLAHLTVHVRGATSGLGVTTDVFHVWTIREGRLARGQSFATLAEARAASTVTG
jgi:ketosteroid isomerase-like protein